jgi:hypothetical protein
VITADRWYDQQPDLTLHYQGDVIRDIPFPTFPPTLPANREEAWPLLRPMKLNGRTVEQAMAQLPLALVGRAARDVDDRWTLPNGEWGVVHFKKQNVMIVSRSCALDNPARKHCLVAPVRTVAALPQQERGDDKLRDLRDNKIPHFFYLPEKENLPESYADLLVLTPIHRTFFPAEQIVTHRVVKLSSVGAMALQQAMSEHFGIQFGFDYEDVCTQAGRYRCSNCFHVGNGVALKNMNANEPFGECEGCGEEAAWVKMPV